MAGIGLSLEIYWEKDQTDLSKCKACNEVIYGPMYIQVLDVNGEKKDLMKVCNSCFTEMNITEWREVSE